MMLPHDPGTLRTWLTEAEGASGHSIHGAQGRVALADLLSRSSLAVDAEQLTGRSVIIAAKTQLIAALALIELDGVASRMVLCPPDLPPQHLPSMIDAAAADAVVAEEERLGGWPSGIERVACSAAITPARAARGRHHPTEWVLLTSGTTGAPKLVVHTLATLSGAFRTRGRIADRPVWSTFYDIRRYGGLQILLRAVRGGGSLVLSDAEEPTADFLARAGAAGLTHISGTPSHWRRVLMSAAAHRIAPRYVRLSGEIADQPILDRLRACYRGAGIGHAFASTEAGVAFEVDDGLSGFPAGLFDAPHNGVEMRLVDGALRLRSARIALRYLGGAGGAIADADGFVDTGDMIEQHGERCYFVGRKGGIINVGGCKVHPEEVEAVINRHPGVQVSLVKARRSPITGAVVVADVVAAHPVAETTEALAAEILLFCRRSLAAHKVPAVVRIVPSLAITAAGKLARRDG